MTFAIIAYKLNISNTKSDMPPLLEFVNKLSDEVGAILRKVSKGNENCKSENSKVAQARIIRSVLCTRPI